MKVNSANEVNIDPGDLRCADEIVALGEKMGKASSINNSPMCRVARALLAAEARLNGLNATLSGLNAAIEEIRTSPAVSAKATQPRNAVLGILDRHGLLDGGP